MTPEELINEIPTDNYLNVDTQFRDAVRAESDRGVAIMCSSMVEQALEVALRNRLSNMSAEDLDEWFCGHNAPFRSFSAKIRLGRGLEIYDDTVEVQLNDVRKIRNVFAHRSLPLAFEHEGLDSLRTTLHDLGVYPTLARREVFGGYALAVTRLLRDWTRGQVYTEKE
jgi:hypothetical protein